MNSKILYLSIPNEGLAVSNGASDSTQRPNFTFKLPVLSNDRVPNMEVELIAAVVSAVDNDYRGGLTIKLMNTSTNYISQDNKGITLGFLKSGVAEDSFNQLSLIAHTDVFGIMMSSADREFRIELKLANGDNPDATYIKQADFIFRLTFPEPNEITDQYSRELAKVRL